MDEQLNPVVRQLSARVVVEAVLKAGPISRAELSRATGFSKQTISDVIRELEKDGWVREQGQVQGAVGRKAVTYEICPDAAFVLGIDLGGTKVHLALANLAGTIVAEVVEPTDLRGGLHVIEQIGRLTEGVARQAGVPQRSIRGSAMGSPGVIDPRTGGITIAPNIPGLDMIDVPEMLKQRLGFDVIIENDVNLAAAGEQWKGNHHSVHTFAFIAVGTGIGMGLVADGRLIRGARGGAGEIAYLPVGGDPFDSRNHLAGTLEMATGSAAIVQRYIGLGGSPGATVRDIFDALERDEAARITIDEVARIIATAIIAIHSIIDPALIILGGSIGVRPELRVSLERHLSRCMTDPVPLDVSSLGSRATLVGAIGTALTHLHRSLFGIHSSGEPASSSFLRSVSDKDVAA
ncbi:ROK family transcriptional regulator [Microvirga aerophila]|uniref:Sugar kinase n=1 Tax=Microvirga aerophila TaxID=670291 RepID=A0A512BTY1_9HYPH|nr:ROK family transcriptional regulator [Microvirga aerophila]GEO15392.1 sugar kinase [Microvirga aerophila]